jgi:antitoxin HicB
MRSSMTYTLLVYEDEDEGGYWAEVAELSGCYTSGDTVDELLENVPDAIAAFMESLEARGESPPPPASFKLEIAVA